MKSLNGFSAYTNQLIYNGKVMNESKREFELLYVRNKIFVLWSFFKRATKNAHSLERPSKFYPLLHLKNDFLRQ